MFIFLIFILPIYILSNTSELNQKIINEYYASFVKNLNFEEKTILASYEKAKSICTEHRNIIKYMGKQNAEKFCNLQKSKNLYEALKASDNIDFNRFEYLKEIFRNNFYFDKAVCSVQILCYDKYNFIINHIYPQFSKYLETITLLNAKEYNNTRHYLLKLRSQYLQLNDLQRYLFSYELKKYVNNLDTKTPWINIFTIGELRKLLTDLILVCVICKISMRTACEFIICEYSRTRHSKFPYKKVNESRFAGKIFKSE